MPSSSYESFSREAFETFDLQVSTTDSSKEVTIHGITNRTSTVMGKFLPPLLLLHGHPQTHHIWHKVAPILALRFTLVIPDLRGHGESSKPTGDESHETYSKRAMANDQIQVMKQLGYDRFFAVGHDRGGRVMHRMALDFPDVILKVMLLDIAPTLAMYEQAEYQFASLYWHWFFLIQSSPLPETFLLASPEAYLSRGGLTISSHSATFSLPALKSYAANFDSEAGVHAMCEDYRASAPGAIDLVQDAADRDAGRKVQCDVRVLWGKKGVIEKLFDAEAEWGKVCKVASGRSVNTGHYIPEEMDTNELATEIIQFFL